MTARAIRSSGAATGRSSASRRARAIAAPADAPASGMRGERDRPGDHGAQDRAGGGERARAAEERALADADPRRRSPGARPAGPGRRGGHGGRASGPRGPRTARRRSSARGRRRGPRRAAPSGARSPGTSAPAAARRGRGRGGRGRRRPPACRRRRARGGGGACGRSARSPRRPGRGGARRRRRPSSRRPSAGSSGSRRSERPRIWRTETPVAALVRSTRQFTHGAFQPSPRKARVPTSARTSPAAKARVASATQRRGRHSPGPRSSTTPSSGGPADHPRLRSPARRRPPPRRARARAARRSRPPPRSAARARSPAAAAARRSAGRPRARGPRRGRSRRPGRGSPRSSPSGRAPVSSASQSTSARSPVPRASASAPSTSTSAIGFAAEPSRSRSTSDAPRRMPVRVSWNPRSRSAAATASRRAAASGAACAVERPQHPVLEQHDPVVEVGRAPVRLAARRARRERQAGGAEEPHARRGEPRMAPLEVGPRHLRAVVALAPAVAEPRDHPLAEVERAVVAVVEEVGDQLAEARLVLVEPLLLRRQRLGEPRELLVRREVPVADHGRRRHLEVDRPEQRRVQLGLLGRQLVRRRRGEPDDVDVGAELLQHRPHDVAPERGEVVALVEHDGGDARGAAARPPARGRRARAGRRDAGRRARRGRSRA